tara:strand:+ start:5144 stop:5869 length:726 start_codon:yes stop_codon:yes gene_type:complete
MSELGLADYVPSPTTKHLALRNTLRGLFGNDKVKPLNNHGNFAVIKTECTSTSWKGESRLTVKVGTFGLEFSEPIDIEDEINARYQRELGYIPPEAVSGMLVEIATRCLNGIPALSGGGGAYWIPENSVPEWKSVVRCAENCSINGRTRATLFTTVLDDDSVKSVIASLDADIQKELALIEKDVSTKDMKKNALKNRLKKSDELREKIRGFEAILGETLQGMHDAVEKTKKHSVVAALQAL